MYNTINCDYKKHSGDTKPGHKENIFIKATWNNYTPHIKYKLIF